MPDMFEERGLATPFENHDPTESDFWDPANFFGFRKEAPQQPTQADITSARVTRDQWNHFLDTYRPVEDDVLRSAMQTDFTAQGDAAGTTAAAGVASAAGTAERNISRSGGSLTAEERAAVGRRTDLSLSKSVGRAENSTRRNLSDTRANLLAGIVGIGNGVSTTASAGLGSAADLAAQRQALGQSQATATRNSNTSTAASAAMLLISLY
jgi:hypothetical protein